MDLLFLRLGCIELRLNFAGFCKKIGLGDKARFVLKGTPKPF